MYRQTSFKHKIQSRAYTFDDVVGTVGGYIGLFLGYALIQIPDLIAYVSQAIRKRIPNRQQNNSV